MEPVGNVISFRYLLVSCQDVDFCPKRNCGTSCLSLLELFAYLVTG